MRSAVALICGRKSRSYSAISYIAPNVVLTMRKSAVSLLIG